MIYQDYPLNPLSNPVNLPLELSSASSYSLPRVQDATRPRAGLSPPDCTILTPGSNANLLSPE